MREIIQSQSLKKVWIFSLIKNLVSRVILNNNRHHNRSSSREYVCVFCDFFFELLDELSSINFWIRCTDLLIAYPYRFYHFFVDVHHFVSVYKSSRINKNMPLNCFEFWVFLERKNNNSSFQKCFSVWEYIPSLYSDRLFIYIECIKCKFHFSSFNGIFVKNHHLSYFKFRIIDRETLVLSVREYMCWFKWWRWKCWWRWNIWICKNSRIESQAKVLPIFWDSIINRTNFLHRRISMINLKKSTLIENIRIRNAIANICNIVSSRIDMRKIKYWKNSCQ